ncbi:unnamed protein product [Candida parapsilosis]|uniref:L-asparaginase n=1 Tax=Candida parapsilosis (strain CDC 317 / ATCC MYA-4646) TaxID=578454 RepID=G8BIB5_CANPC|nr:uncharacterized protein CPAR2_401820 [Candida parapsilosis]CCE44380.1 hypothetical protein CPAR2_401820 [Candida parapsilosis]
MQIELDQVVVLHIGAGNHKQKNNNEYVKLMKQALKKSNVIEVNDILEHSSLTNTGYGSSLNVLGEVEIDASYIKSNGETGALSGLQVDSPTKEMFRIFNKIDDLYNREANLSRPLSLHCASLSRFMNIPVNEHLVSPKSKKIYDMYKDTVFRFPHQEIEVNDTIGSLVIDTNSNQTVLATTSGGHFFKLSGRIGCAGIIGAGIYYEQVGDLEISCMCSGNGEQIVQNSLAQLIVKNISRMDDEGEYGVQLQKLIFAKARNMYCGFIVVLKRASRGGGGEGEGGGIQLLYGHTTETFYFGTRVNNATRVVLSCAEKDGKFTFGEYKLK